jgi:hypothetical protein
MFGRHYTSRDMSEKRCSTGAATTSAWTVIDTIAVVLLVLLALVPRTVNLLGLDPLIDEASTTDWAFRQFELASPRTWLIPILTDGRPPLATWLMVPFGAFVDNGILAGRLAAAIAGALSAGALYALGRELASRTVGAVAAILWAVSPFPVFYARVAVDDALLTLLVMLTTWASVCLARRPTVRTGALCGLCLALAVLTKTTAVLLAAAPVLAIIMLGQPSGWRAYVRPLLAAFVAGLIVDAPLLLGVLPLLAQVGLHTGSSSSTGGDLLRENLTIVAGWAQSFVGNVFLLLTGLGLLLTLLLRQWGLLYVGLLGGSLILVLLGITTTLFARYLLFLAFPAYLLAAYPIERASMAMQRLPLPPATQKTVRTAVSAVVVVVGLAVALGERADLAVAVVRDPAQANIPGSEHMGYVENWFAVYGLGPVVDELRARGRERPVTVLVPPASRESRVMVPYSVLRMYLRREPNVRIVEVPSLWRAQDLRDVRRIARDGPTYLVVNGSYTDGPGIANDVPAYTRQLERRLAQDVPEAHEVLRIPRPLASNWLVLYRLDG